MNPGCNFESNGPNSKEPRSLDYHRHLVIMHVRTVNHASDTLGTVSIAGSGFLLARRDGGHKLTRDGVDLGRLPTLMQFVYPDSEVHICSTSIDHYVGYQTMYGGDTTRYGEMDRYGPWEVRIIPSLLAAVFTAGESASVNPGHIDMVPDTVRPGGILDLDISVDLGGLLEWQPTQARYNMRTDHIHVKQR